MMLIQITIAVPDNGNLTCHIGHRLRLGLAHIRLHLLHTGASHPHKNACLLRETPEGRCVFAAGKKQAEGCRQICWNAKSSAARC
jgi:hypothetical protein